MMNPLPENFDSGRMPGWHSMVMRRLSSMLKLSSFRSQPGSDYFMLPVHWELIV